MSEVTHPRHGKDENHKHSRYENISLTVDQVKMLEDIQLILHECLLKL